MPRIKKVDPVVASGLVEGNNALPEIETPVFDDDGLPIHDTIIKPEIQASAQKEYFEQLKFNEMPVSIQVSVSQQGDTPETYVYCGNNGKGIEVMIDGKWVAMGYIPVDQQLTTKIKYAELLLQSTEISIAGDKKGGQGAHDVSDFQSLRRRENRRYSVSVAFPQDRRYQEWYNRVSATR